MLSFISGLQILIPAAIRKSLLLIAMLSIHPAASSAQTQVDKIKAAFLLNFAKYIEWPEIQDGDEPKDFKFCIAGSREQMPIFKELEKKTLDNKAIIVSLVEKSEEVETCQVVLLSEVKGQEIGKDVLSKTKGKPILIVSDVGEDGMIYLFEEEGRIKFKVNLINAQGSGLSFRSQMLQLASQVKS